MRLRGRIEVRMAAIVVTGGGVGGLVAAMVLAEDGHDVTLLERDRGRALGAVGGLGALGAPRASTSSGCCTSSSPGSASSSSASSPVV